ncbi:MAG TPA: hypothetical protein VEX68_19850 [Bryobacteraceae bacterium]|nr:hypothetical protein [Bryobacteraceae bacterium]
MENFRRFEAVDPYNRTWQVEFRWQQNAISIRHSDSIDVKYQLIQGEDVSEKVIALRHPDLLALGKKAGREVTDAWILKLAALNIREMIETDRDMEKTLVTARLEDLQRYNEKLSAPAPIRR